ncbi:hypothetical protein N9P32_00610 [Flavobacteriaceae bacterium]|jgi:hypothetical protein|nr:hypothetical protein [Flavobacteriaceae bacterium]MDA9330184.1 hypothetical protein [bacterium]MDA9323804.1 hypothetical protein [Flavobacteriaceae bacterium]MDB4093012.1 hypothetical protein [Flavobacteriaceae bacterium]MDC1279467.1 hypothetical protein [Flavobacteriaceae bacterium]|tara:strand:- start:515 stop:964 length:450 start_codon:yes stop_codon:yes gene_type:complete
MNLTIIFEWILQLHSLWAILTMTIIFYTVLRFFFNALQNKIFTLLDLRIALFTLIFCHIQFIIGIVLYFLSPKFKWWYNGLEEILENNEYFFYLVKHPLLNIFSILSITIGWSLFKKAKTNQKRFTRIGVFYLIGFLLILLATPYGKWL